MRKLLLLFAACALSLSTLWAQSTISGKVTASDSDAPIEGATVLVKGTTVGTFTDGSGNYQLNVPGGGETLVISFVGYDRVEVAINGRTTINVTMNQSSLEEVVVTGYSTQTKAKVISSVAVVGKEAVENVALPDINQIMQGRAPGVMVTGGSGQPGSFQNVRIRGIGSISGSREPLYVIDGVIVNRGNAGVSGNSPSEDILSSLNPNDIESLNILKDATATALYGSRGSNGVVVITTKRGREGKTNFNVRAQYGITENNIFDFDKMDAQTQLQYERETLEAAGFDQATIDATRPSSLADVNTNWQDLAFQQGQSQMYEISAQGGTRKTQFFFSGNYFNQDGIVIESGFERMSFRMNLDHRALNDKLRISLQNNLTRSVQESATAGNRFSSPLLASFLFPPWLRVRDPETGELLQGNEPASVDNFDFFVQDNPVRSVQLNDVFSTNLRYLGNVNATYKLTDWLSAQGVFGLDYIDVRENNFFDPTTNDGRDENGSVQEFFNNVISYTARAQLNFNKTFGEQHSIDGLVTYEFQKNESENFSAGGESLASGKLKTLNSTATNFTAGGSATESSFISYLGQINYNFADKYYVTANFRRDGSSRFGANNRWANFWSVGASWRASQEAFLQNVDFLSNLKVRASYGSSGNAGIGNFPSLELYGFGSAYNGIPGSAPSQVPNPDLTWEVSYMLNLGVDFGFFNDRITGTVEVYDKQTEELLFNVPISSTSGFTSATRNIGQVQNQGIEGLISVLVFDGDFRWSTDFNISANRSEIISLPDGEDIINGRQILREGEAIRSWYLRRWAGVNPANGKPLWRSPEGGVTEVYTNSDREIVGRAEPDFIGGWNNSFSWKGISLSAFFYIASGLETYDGTRGFIEADGARQGWGKPAYVADRWRQPGDISERPEAVWGGQPNSTSASTRFLYDGSYIRLRNLTLAYSLPAKIVNTIGLTKVRFYGQGQNILTITDYRGFDPELETDGDEFFRYPNGRNWTFGVDIGF